MMNTFVYMVRHGDSPKTEGSERTRGLTEKGKVDATRVTDILQKEGIEVFVSSPYTRSILTIQELADRFEQEIVIVEDLKERVFSSADTRMADKELLPLLEKSFVDFDFALTGAESNTICQKRAICALKQLLETYKGKKIVLGTNGAVMTLMMAYYDSQYDLDFLLQTSKPDIYRMEFDGEKLVEVTRLWK
jgi:2,3-bisphosphoglycerate-dependent phosphoglycerate mutase